MNRKEIATQVSMKPFNLELALKGMPVQTRGGKEVLEIKMFNKSKNMFPVVCRVEGYYLFTDEKGCINSLMDDDSDLFMVNVTNQLNVRLFTISGGFLCVATENTHDIYNNEYFVKNTNPRRWVSEVFTVDVDYTVFAPKSENQCPENIF